MHSWRGRAPSGSGNGRPSAMAAVPPQRSARRVRGWYRARACRRAAGESPAAACGARRQRCARPPLRPVPARPRTCPTDASRCNARWHRGSHAGAARRRAPRSPSRDRACCRRRSRCRRSNGSACAASDCRRSSPYCAAAARRRPAGRPAAADSARAPADDRRHRHCRPSRQCGCRHRALHRCLPAAAGRHRPAAVAVRRRP